MSEREKELIGKKAATIARQHHITDVERVRRILEKYKIHVRGRLGPLEFDNDLFSEDSSLVPSLDEALRFLPAEKALELFENSTRGELITKVASVECWFSGQTLFFTYQELAHLIEKFMDHLIKNKASILGTGRPKKKFDDSSYLHNRIVDLYPLAEVPSKKDKEFVDRVIRRANNPEEEMKKMIISFWILYSENRDREPLTYFDPETMFSYQKNPALYSFTRSENQQLEEQRPRLLNMKLKILEIACQHIRKRVMHEDNHTGFWGECANIMSSSLSQQDFKFLDSSDRKYLNIYFLRILRDNLDSPLVDPIRLPRKIRAGGLKDILDLIFFVDTELTTGKAHITKTKIMPLLGNKIPESYYQLVLSPRKDEIDKVLNDSFTTSKEEESKHSFSERLKDVKSRFKIRLYVSPNRYELVEKFHQFVESGKGVDIDITGRFVAPLPSTKEVYPVRVPPGTTWEDITIKFSDEHNVKITVRGQTHHFDYKQMGFEDLRRHLPNKQWDLLKLLALRKGELVWGDPASHISVKKKKERLSKALKVFFQIAEEPFHPYSHPDPGMPHIYKKSYQIRITLDPANLAR